MLQQKACWSLISSCPPAAPGPDDDDRYCQNCFYMKSAKWGDFQNEDQESILGGWNICSLKLQLFSIFQEYQTKEGERDEKNGICRWHWCFCPKKLKWKTKKETWHLNYDFDNFGIYFSGSMKWKCSKLQPIHILISYNLKFSPS